MIHLSNVERLKSIVSLITGVETSKIDDHASLEQLGIDDLDTVELVMDVEAEFDIVIPHDAAISDLDDLVAYIA